jgi:hypothetical protein
MNSDDRASTTSLTRAVKGIDGALVEHKAAPSHYTTGWSSPTQRARLQRRALFALRPWRRTRSLVLIPEKQGLEARLAGPWNKGTAVASLLREPWARVPVYFGDDPRTIMLSGQSEVEGSAGVLAHPASRGRRTRQCLVQPLWPRCWDGWRNGWRSKPQT